MNTIPALPECLRLSAVALSQVNEVSSIFNLWIVSAGYPGLQAAWLSLTYGVIEPLWTIVFLRWPVNPWTMIIACAGLHMHAGTFLIHWMASQVDHHFSHSRSQDASAVKPEITGTGTTDEKLEEGKGVQRTTVLSTSTGILVEQTVSAIPTLPKIRFALVPMLFTASMVNTSLMLSAKSFMAPSYHAQPTLVHALGVFSLVVFLCSRIMDGGFLAFLNPRPSRSAPRKITTTVLLRFAFSFCFPHPPRTYEPLLNLGLLFITRATVRHLCGLDPLLGLHKPATPEVAEELFGIARYEWVSEVLPNPGPWFAILSAPISALLSLGAVYLIRRDSMTRQLGREASHAD